MISIKLKGDEDPAPYVAKPYVGRVPYIGYVPHESDKPNGNILTEVLRRDAIVRKLYKDCPYTKGETVTPTTPQDLVKYGKTIIVQHICSCYVEMGSANEWPKGDNPYIVGAFAPEKNVSFYCTTNFLEPLKDK